MAIPRIVPRPEHNISRKMLDPDALRALYRLRGNGFTAYLVGGSVRDLLLGREPKDFDLATNATPGQIKKLFRNCRLVGRRFRLAHLHFGEKIIEVATFRSGTAEAPPDQEELTGNERSPRHLRSDEGMLLRDNLFGTPEEDAVRRDFSVNALFYNIADFSVIDYTGGMEDLQKGQIRTIGDPASRIVEDPVRMLRAIRFSAILGFKIDDATWRAINELASTITMASAPRLYDELLKLFLSGEGAECYQLMRQSGLLKTLFPRFGSWLDRETGGFPHTTVGKSLEWVDTRVRQGEKVAPQLLYSLLFRDYVAEMGKMLGENGGSVHRELEAALPHLFQEIGATMHMPGRAAAAVRHILLYQSRFAKKPGRHPGSFLRRPDFGDALSHLVARDEILGENEGLGEWWSRYVAQSPAEAASAAGEEKPAKPKKRRRRRPRKRDNG
jgi:poly(A) polymerase